jgi:hypothetical protein
LRALAIALLALIVLFALLFVSFGPSVQAGARPTARDVAAARDVWHQLKPAQVTGATTQVRVDNGAMRGLAALASDATGIARFEGQVARGVLSGRASVSLPAGLWINVSASATGRHNGFPAYRLKIGRVTFPSLVSRWVAELGRWMLRLKGANIPPLDTIVRQVSVDRQEVRAVLALPKSSGVVGGLIAARAKALNDPLVSAIYCRIAAAQRAAPVADLSQIVGKIFREAPAGAPEEYSRAAFVALSFLVVGEQAEALAPNAAELTRKCPRGGAALSLQHREDLAKHWTFSAALMSVLGEDATASLGEWKELRDSLPNGSGFSFVDLAADRSGMRIAVRALDPGTAAETVNTLRRATDADLLPEALLQEPEGLSEATFVNRFGSLDQERYRRAVVSIDQTLTRERAAR